jgi:hypothetical protein
MTKMYVANCTNQVQQFVYRLPEIPAPRSQTIDIGRQVLLSGELTTKDIEAIIKQHSKYGFKSVQEVEQKSNAGERPFVGLVYSLDKYINVEKIKRVLLLNHNVLILRGSQQRKAAAVAASDAINQQTEGTPLALKALELQAEEMADNKNPNPEFNEGVRVSSEETPTETTGRNRKSRASRASEA